VKPPSPKGLKKPRWKKKEGRGRLYVRMQFLGATRNLRNRDAGGVGAVRQTRVANVREKNESMGEASLTPKDNETQSK